MDLALEILRTVDFFDPARARRNLETVLPLLPPDGPGILHLLLRQVPDPDRALNYFERYVSAPGAPVQSMFAATSRLHAAIAVFSHSNFLADILFRHPQTLEWAMDESKLYRVLATGEIRSDLGWLPVSADDNESARILARFRRMHILRIALRDLLGVATLAEVALELSNLSDAILQGAREHVQQQLASRFGRPLCATAAGSAIECEFVVLALGKLGGRELNYSSDIDLLFLYTGDGETSGPIQISNRQFCVDLANRLTQLLCRPTPEGACYRVDLRLRPEGAMGEVVTSLRTAVDYYHQRARDWELQMLIKARPAAGSAKLGRTFLDSIEPLIYQTSTDFSTIERVAETRDRIQEKLRRRGGSGLNIKLTRGGIRDIEFLVQCLQRLYGGRDPWVRSGGTLFALHRLRDKGYLSMPDYARLNSAYQYLRVLEHRLQIEDDRQTHTLPSGTEALELLARKMHGVHSPGKADDELLRQVQSHLKNVAEIYERVVHAQRPVDLPDEEPPQDLAPDHGPEPPSEHSWRSQLLHLEQKSPRVGAVLRSVNIRWGRTHFEHFLNKIVSMPRLLGELETLPPLLECAADLIEHSPYLAEHLIRHPEDTLRLRAVAGGESDEAPPGAWAAGPGDMHPEMERMLESGSSFEEKSTWLRHFYRLQMLEILAESVYRQFPIFATLGKTSRLAEWVVRAAYRIAVDDIVRFSNWSGPREHMSVITLGRLGMREFDLASDADLIFVIPDEERPQRLHWMQVVERLIEITSSYTREGLIFTVDTRLRPMGRDGELVQTESYYKSYFGAQAEAWEAITYMKARTIAGDIERGKRFLTELQDVGWRRYGRSGELTSFLVGMRERLEREQGGDSPIKAGAGGYYDIDFILMYLRLRDAGVFFESLNTPERIEVVRALGGLPSDQAQKLFETAVFFRSLDHAIRVCLGHSAGAIPVARQKRAPITALTRRWSELPPADTPLGPFFHQTRRATRELFVEIFQGKGVGQP